VPAGTKSRQKHKNGEYLYQKLGGKRIFGRWFGEAVPAGTKSHHKRKSGELLYRKLGGQIKNINSTIDFCNSYP
jgi:hypothetical protein